MVGCDGLLWHQYIADYCLHADKELVAKISQDAKDRMLSGKQIDPTLHKAEPRKSGEATEVLAEIAGTGK